MQAELLEAQISTRLRQEEKTALIANAEAMGSTKDIVLRQLVWAFNSYCAGGRRPAFPLVIASPGYVVRGEGGRAGAEPAGEEGGGRLDVGGGNLRDGANLSEELARGDFGEAALGGEGGGALVGEGELQGAGLVGGAGGALHTAEDRGARGGMVSGGEAEAREPVRRVGLEADGGHAA